MLRICVWAFVTFVLGWGIGAYREFHKHCRFCSCLDCKQWRNLPSLRRCD